MDFRDEIIFLALTIEQEAAHEPYQGKLAVAFVIMNRATASKASVIDTVLKASQFSCWNTESPTRQKIDDAAKETLWECYKAAVAAYFGLAQDPSLGADHYLNEEYTKYLRGGNLPTWFDEKKVTVRIGHHTFLKLA